MDNLLIWMQELSLESSEMKTIMTIPLMILPYYLANSSIVNIQYIYSLFYIASI